MITKIRLGNFKCFETLSLPLKNVSVLTGMNGAGKSTVIQALLLLRQSFLEDGNIRSLHLNGRYAELGNARDVLYEKAKADSIEIDYVTEENDQFAYQFRYYPDSDNMPLDASMGMNYGIEIGYANPLFVNNFVYLSAFRIKPQDLYSITNEEELGNREFGNNGEYALQYLRLYGDNLVANQKAVIEDKAGNTLLNQTRLWLGKISPGVSPQILIDRSLRTSELRYEYVEGKNKTNSYKSVNVGFGITYVLPVIVALLSARKGDIIIVENPEAHIHPAGQRILGELIAMAGSGGVQVLVETHSDHIINGIRIAVKQKKISGDDVQLAFFYRDTTDDFKHKYTSPRIQDDGRLDMWPDGFFDEWDKALYDLI